MFMCVFRYVQRFGPSENECSGVEDGSGGVGRAFMVTIVRISKWVIYLGMSGAAINRCPTCMVFKTPKGLKQKVTMSACCE